MAVDESFLKVGGTVDLLDTTKVEQDDGTETHREVVVIGDPEDNEARLDIKKTPLGSDHKLPVGDPTNEDILDALHALIEETRMVRFHLNLITGFET